MGVFTPKDGNIRLELVALLNAGVTTDGANVDHAAAELNKSTTLLGKLELGDVSKAKVRELLVLFLSKPLDEAGAGKRLAHAVRNQTVLREAEVEQSGDIGGGAAELLLLLDEVGAADLQHVRRGGRQ